MTGASDHIVVGLDGSQGSEHALRWALAHVDRFGPVQPVAAWRYPWWALAPTTPATVVAPAESQFHEEAERVVERMLDRVDPEDRLEIITVHGAAGPALVDLAGEASLLVVGTRGRGAVASGLLGSVSTHCINHATVPVAVVPPEAPIEPRFGRIVVGVDGSEHSTNALAWTLVHTPEATTVEALFAWDPDPGPTAGVPAMAEEHHELQARRLARDAVAEAGRRAGRPERPVSVKTRCGDARTILRNEAEEADLLVLGARGRRRVAYLLIGSVTTALAHNPPVTTIIVP